MWAPGRAGVGLRAQPHSCGLHPTPCSPAPSLSGRTQGLDRVCLTAPWGSRAPGAGAAAPAGAHRPRGCTPGRLPGRAAPVLEPSLPPFPQGMGCSHLGARLGRAELRQWQDEKAWALGTLWDLEGRPLHSPGLTGRGELWSAPHGGFCLHTCQSQSRGHMLPSTVCPHPPGCKK